MNLQKLQVFLTLCETLNYTETAERLYISQGNVSKQIMALEKELGVQLFDRSRRHIKITKEGQVVGTYARRILDNYQQMTAELLQLQKDKEHKLLLHGIPSMPFYAIISEIAGFKKSHMNFEVSVEEEEADVLLDNLLKHKCDIIFARQFNDKLPKEVEMLTIDQDRWVVVLPSQHPLARKESINLKELEGEKFLQLSEKTQLLQPLLELCYAYQFDPKITYKGNRINLIIDFIENDLGLSLMMEKMVRPFEGKQIIWRPLDIETESLMVLMKLKTNKSEAVQQFWQEMQEKYAKKD
ncbi:LysR family transcriptional regulator [Streptococcus ruminicola]|uniref:LysR family transcriptional regulator n=1 Tax=Streptococcus ruminicola TaxID=2686210 RepID=A0AAE6R4R5_9STRE|nr:LysR family transcriptional regulator [Streptococcus ruminicola]QGZ27651.1 LysR family transcriptional regulator [Streptococcus ruminicola]